MLAICKYLNSIQAEPFRGFSRMKGEGAAKRPPFHKICHTYPTMMELGELIPYLKKIHKIYKLLDISVFLLEISKFCYIKKYRYRLYFDTLFLIRLTFFDS